MKKLLFILSFLVASTSYAQEVIGDSLRIADTKAGKVASILKKNGNGIKKVCITGQINAKDLQALATVPGLTTLDLSGTMYKATTFNNHLSTAICELPYYNTLDILKLPKGGFSGKTEYDLLEVRLQTIPRLISLRCNVMLSSKTASNSKSFNEVEFDLSNIEKYDSAIKRWKEYNNHFFNKTAEILYVVNGDFATANRYMNSTIMCDKSKRHVVLNGRWDNSIDEKWLSLVTEFGRGASIDYYPNSHLSFPKVTSIPSNLIGYQIRKKIKTIDLPSVIVFDVSTLYDTGIKNITLPASLEALTISWSNYCVENIDTIRLLGSTPPQLTYPIDPSKKQKVVFVVPDGAKKKYKNAPSWKGVIVQEVNGGGATIDPSKSYNIKVEKPGTILSYLPVDKLNEIEAVTVTGLLYETDLEVLSECKNLISVDLTNTYICFSPEVLKEKKANAEMWAGFAKAMGAVADMKYNDFDMSTSDYVYSKLFTKLLEEGSNVKESDIKCVIPKGAFRDCLNLESIKFPTRCSVIEDKVCYGCSELKEVVLPPYLQEINTGAFAYCKSLKEIKIPKTLKYIGWRTSYSDPCAFGCSGIEVLDFSGCVFKETKWTCDLEGCRDLKELRFPKNITFVDDLSTNKGAHYYFSDTEVHFYHTMSLSNTYLHFRQSTPPNLDNPTGTTFYIPKGTTTAYYAKFGKNNKYIEE